MTGTRKTLEQRAAEWARAMSDGATGPLRIAMEVVDVIDHWVDYKDEAGGVEPGSWLAVTFAGTSMNVGFWRRRAEAVQVLDDGKRTVHRRLHHDAAVWLAGRPAEYRAETYRRCLVDATRRGRPLMLGEVQTHWHKVAPKKAQPEAKPCERCAELEKEIERLKAKVCD